MGHGKYIKEYNACVEEGNDNENDARMSPTNERDVNSPPGDAVQRNRYQQWRWQASDKANADYGLHRTVGGEGWH